MHRGLPLLFIHRNRSDPSGLDSTGSTLYRLSFARYWLRKWATLGAMTIWQ
jgi:hypothetical protein